MTARADDDGPFLQLIYFSRSQVGTRPEAVASAIWAIETRARRFNTQAGITGALYYSGPHFAQVLEGPREAVLLLIAAIAADTRHTDVTIVQEEMVPTRAFGGWAMAYVDGTSEEIIRLSPAINFEDLTHERRGPVILAMMKYLVLGDHGGP